MYFKDSKSILLSTYDLENRYRAPCEVIAPGVARDEAGGTTCYRQNAGPGPKAPRAGIAIGGGWPGRDTGGRLQCVADNGTEINLFRHFCPLKRGLIYLTTLNKSQVRDGRITPSLPCTA